MSMKKYKVRVRLAQTGIYVVQWTRYRWIPIWRTVLRFRQPPYAYEHTCNGWEDKLFSYKEAETFALEINTYEKLNRYYEKQNFKEKEYLDYKQRRDSDSTPYKTKYL